MKVTKILQDGNVFDAAVLDLNADVIKAKFVKAILNQSKLALAVGVPCTSSAPHSLLNGFKNLVAVSAMTGFEFDQAKAFLSAAKSSGPAAAGGAAAAKVEAVVEEKEEDVDMGDLFGGDDDGY